MVNIPFNFVSHGQAFPAGQYAATLDPYHNVLALSSTTNPRVSARWIAGPADDNPNNSKLILKFDDLGNTHTLRTVQLGPGSRQDWTLLRDATMRAALWMQ